MLKSALALGAKASIAAITCWVSGSDAAEGPGEWGTEGRDVGRDVACEVERDVGRDAGREVVL